MSEPSLARLILSRRMLACLLTGFSSGMPLYVLVQLVPAWLQSEGVDLASIGLMTLVGLPYTWKFLWSPLLDRYVPPLFGRRRGWMLVFQALLALTIAALGLLDPAGSLQTVAALCTVVALFSASQDIVIDAFRAELLSERELGLGNAMHVNAYRVSGLIPGGLALVLADTLPWGQVFALTGAFMAVGVVGALLAPEPAVAETSPRTLREAVVEPFLAFFARTDRAPWLLLAFLLLYKLGDSMATALITPFYLDIGFTKTQVGSIAKVVGLWSSVVGAFLGGGFIARWGIHKALWVFGVVQLVSILGLAALAEIGPDPWALSGAVCAEYLGVGLGTAALLSFMARETDKRFTATQFALLSSLVALPRTVVNASTGVLAESLGWTSFFLLCTALALPGMALLPLVAPWGRDPGMVDLPEAS